MNANRKTKAAGPFKEHVSLWNKSLRPSRHNYLLLVDSYSHSYTGSVPHISHHQSQTRINLSRPSYIANPRGEIQGCNGK